MSKKVVLAILDGYGILSNETLAKGDAITLAHPNNILSLTKNYPSVELIAAGEGVGLPDGQIGNSEVGHLNIGAGRVVYTGLSLVNYEIKSKKYFQNKTIIDAILHSKKNNSNFHILGLLSDGGVHSHQEHIYATIELAHSYGVRTYVHAFGDGRDVKPSSMIGYLKELKEVCRKNNAIIASVSGRYYAMDRDENFERTMLAYDAIVNNKAKTFKDPVEYVQDSYDQKILDEFIVPAVNSSPDSRRISNNDSVFFANYRPDRARQLSHLLVKSELYKYELTRLTNLYFVTMMQYEKINCNAVAYPPTILKQLLGEVIDQNGMKQLRIAETEKYAHVTFFFDGGNEIALKHCDRILIPSPKVATYDLDPGMSASKITDALIPTLGKYNLTVVNYANPDMVGHTGNLDATIKAIKIVDNEIKRLYEACKMNGITLMITADHGNAEEKIDELGNPSTKHTTNNVPFIVCDSKVKLNEDGKLSNIAPTILEYMNIKVPSEMNEKSLIK
jgi:2,3-bisphosphoglycerate-independent phosphoglycerate mutase